MLGSIGAVVNPDIPADVLVSEVGIEVRPTQPPQQLRIVDVPNSGYPEDLETFGTPDTVDITDILSVDVMPLTSTSTSGMDVTSCPDMSVAKSMSFDSSAYYVVVESGAHREIQNPTTSSFVDDNTRAY